MRTKLIGLSAVFTLLFPFLSAAQTVTSSTQREQLKGYVADLQKNPSDDALREKTIKLALTISPKPVSTSEIDEQVGAANYAFKNAISDSDLIAAANAYATASTLAPWVPEYYFNQGVSLEKAKQFDRSIAAFNWYLMAAPDAQDAKEVRERIGGLKFALRKSSETRTEQPAADQARTAEEERKAREPNFTGMWKKHQYEFMEISRSSSSGYHSTEHFGTNPPGYCDQTDRIEVQGRHIQITLSCANGGRGIHDLLLSADGQELTGTYSVYPPNGKSYANQETFKRQ